MAGPIRHRCDLPALARYLGGETKSIRDSHTTIPLFYCADTQFLRWKGRQLRLMGCEVLEKPFRLDDLLREVREMIGTVAQSPQET
jgi:hypothetical protein